MFPALEIAKNSQIVLLCELSLDQDIVILHRQPRTHLEGVTVERPHQRPLLLGDRVADMLAPVDCLDAKVLWILRHQRLHSLLKQLFARIFGVTFDLYAFGVFLGEEVVARCVDVLVRIIDGEPLLETSLLQADGLVLG